MNLLNIFFLDQTSSEAIHLRTFKNTDKSAILSQSSQTVIRLSLKVDFIKLIQLDIKKKNNVAMAGF